MFFINTVIGHLWHVVPGAHYRRMYGTDFNPFLYQLIEQTADHFHWDTGEVWSDIPKLGLTPTPHPPPGPHPPSPPLTHPAATPPPQYPTPPLPRNLHPPPPT